MAVASLGWRAILDLVSEVAVAFPASGEWTLEDLLVLPETGFRYEIIEGSLLVTPPAGVLHGVIVAQLVRQLQQSAPEDLFVFPGGIGVRLGRSVLIPDLVVATVTAATAGGPALEPAHVVLVVEVLSASNRMTDLLTKRAVYAAGGIVHYWIVDPDPPSLLALRLHGDGYRTVADVRGESPYDVTEPFPLSLSPARLCRP